MNLFSLGGFLSNFFSDTWMSLWLSLNDFVYSLISILYRVFEGIANVNLFSENVFKEITSRIYIIMGIAMLFIFAYNLILMIINPEEKKSTGQTTKVVKEVIISLVLVILLPTIFNYMAIFQKHILDSQILSQIILGNTGGTSAEKCDYTEYTIFNSYGIGNNVSFWDTLSMGTIDLLRTVFSRGVPTDMLTKACEVYSTKLTPSQRGAYALPVTIFSAFYYPTKVDYYMCETWIETCKNDKNCSTTDVSDDEDKEMCAYYVYDVKMAKYIGNISPFNNESKFYSKVKVDDGTFEFNGLMALIAGALGIWMFICYGMAIGTRVAKLGVLQLLSPIAVMMRVVPKQKEAFFDKWLKQLINTYLDVFIRLIIIYFSLFAISLVPEVLDTLRKSVWSQESWYIIALATVVIDLGILMFAQQAPDLIKDFFGSNGNFALKSPRKQFNENKLAKGIVGAVPGAALGAASGIMSGNPLKAVTGAFKGGKNAFKNTSNADLTKKGAFMDTIKNSKYQTDYEQNHTKFQAIKNGIDQAGGIGKYLDKKGQDFVDFIKGANPQEQFGSIGSLFSKSAEINDLIIKGTIEEEATAKDNWAKGENIDLGNNYYRRDKDRGVWIGPDGKEYNKEEMEEQMKDYYKKAKVEAMTQAMINNDKGQHDKFKEWTEQFNKTMLDNFPKLSEKITKDFFEKITNAGGIKITNMDELMTTLAELQNRGAAGDIAAFEQLSKLTNAMNEGFNDMKKRPQVNDSQKK